MIFLYGLAFAFLFGMIIGSFLNVCIYRIPAGRSIVSPRSSCPECGTVLAWYQNIPIVSYVFLRGRCASCSCHVSLRYPLVEALSGVTFALVFYRVGFHESVVVYWFFAAALLTIAFIDLDHQIIPDIISLPGIVVGFLCSFFLPWVTWVDSVLGIVVGGGSLLVIGLLYELIARREGMGGGDVKLLAMIGAFLGWQSIVPIVFFSSVMGTVIGVPVMLLKKADSRLAIPFGPFLVVSALIYFLRGREIILWYLSTLGPL